MSRRKTLNAVSDGHSFYDETPPSYASDEGRFEGLPEILASYPGELLKRYHERRSRGRRSGAPSPEPVVEEYHEGSRTTNKE